MGCSDAENHLDSGALHSLLSIVDPLAQDV